MGDLSFKGPYIHSNVIAVVAFLVSCSLLDVLWYFFAVLWGNIQASWMALAYFCYP